MAETEVDAGDVRAAAGGIVDAVDAVVGRVVVVDGTAAGAAGRAGEDTRSFLPRICTDQHGYEKGATARVVAFLLCFIPTCRARLGCCLSPLRGWLLFLVLTPRLAPWAVICRRFAAGFDGRAALRGAEAPLFHGAACFGGGSPSARLKARALPGKVKIKVNGGGRECPSHKGQVRSGVARCAGDSAF